MILIGKKEEMNRLLQQDFAPLSLAMLDLDFFLRYAMRLAPPETGRLYAEISGYLSRAFGSNPVYALRGDDLFYVVLRGLGETQAETLVQEVLRAYRRQRFARFLGEGYRHVRMTFSAGISSCRDQADVPGLLRRAQTALFTAKSMRRGQTAVYGTPPPAPVSRVLSSPGLRVRTVLGRWGETGRITRRLPARDGLLDEPQAVACGENGALYLADQNNHQIICLENGTVHPVLGTGRCGRPDGEDPARWAFNKPTGVSVTGSSLYVADTGNDLVVCYDLVTGRGQIVCGTGQAGRGGDGGPAVRAQLNKPGGVVSDYHGSLYINDIANNVIRKVDPHGTVTTFAGTGEFSSRGDGGSAHDASFHEIYAIAVDHQKEYLYLADYFGHRIRKINFDTGLVSTVAGCGTCGDRGDGGDPLLACLNRPVALCLGKDGTLYIAESGSHRVRVVDRHGRRISTLLGGIGMGTGHTPGIPGFRLANPNGLVAYQSTLYLLDGANNRLCQINLSEETS